MSYKGQTTAAGDYSLPYVDVGTYSITVEAPGFQKFTRTEIIVQINRFIIERDQTNSLYFLNGDVQRAVIDQERKDNIIPTYIRDSTFRMSMLR